MYLLCSGQQVDGVLCLCRFKDIRFNKEHVSQTTSPGKMIQEHAILGALAIVYYMRLNDTFRERYRKELGRKMKLSFGTNIDQALQEEVRDSSVCVRTVDPAQL